MDNFATLLLQSISVILMISSWRQIFKFTFSWNRRSRQQVSKPSLSAKLAHLPPPKQINNLKPTSWCAMTNFCKLSKLATSFIGLLIHLDNLFLTLKKGIKPLPTAITIHGCSILTHASHVFDSTVFDLVFGVISMNISLIKRPPNLQVSQRFFLPRMRL